MKVSRLLLGLVLVLLACPFLTLAGGGDGDKPAKGKGKGKGGDVVEIDLGKLPPALAQELRAQLAGAGKKKGAKVISLTEAIRVAEAQGKGEVTSAQRRQEGGVIQFRIDVVRENGR